MWEFVSQNSFEWAHSYLILIFCGVENYPYPLTRVARISDWKERNVYWLYKYFFLSCSIGDDAKKGSRHTCTSQQNYNYALSGNLLDRYTNQNCTFAFLHKFRIKQKGFSDHTYVWSFFKSPWIQWPWVPQKFLFALLLFSWNAFHAPPFRLHPLMQDNRAREVSSDNKYSRAVEQEARCARHKQEQNIDDRRRRSASSDKLPPDPELGRTS